MNNNIQEKSFSAEPLPGSSARATRALLRFRVDSNSASVRANEAYQRLVKSDVKYRFVIDMASPK